ncbi:MAG: outer membrane lipoprotein-sorting protein [Zoogloeaceae bacterium]|jgi:hypothetical protein|nr:outer membrane lipoprotein-sorting protein [Zoogloeaceae bacterium]
MKSSIARIFFLAAALAAFLADVALAADAGALLKNADQARGGGISGLVWDVHAVSVGAPGDDPVPDHRLQVKATMTASLAEILEPPNSKGKKLLQVDRNMWMTKPNLRKPVAISPRLRLTGQAAIGDIAATNYAKDYAARLLGEEACGDETCHVLELTANSRRSTYDRVTYWVSKSRGLAVKADFLTPSGKRLKSAQFEYGNTLSIEGKKIAFVSRMIITDALSEACTTLEYSNIRLREIPAAEFDVANLQ